jgi:hypothetical protein
MLAKQREVEVTKTRLGMSGSTMSEFMVYLYSSSDYEQLF